MEKTVIISDIPGNMFEFNEKSFSYKVGSMLQTFYIFKLGKISRTLNILDRERSDAQCLEDFPFT